MFGYLMNLQKEMEFEAMLKEIEKENKRCREEIVITN